LGFEHHLDVASAVIAVGAAVALWGFKRSVIQVIAGCAFLGLIFKTVL